MNPIDTEALNVATKAKQQIDSHETHCAERWIETRDAINGLYKRMWIAATAVIGAQAGIIVGLIKWMAPGV